MKVVQINSTCGVGSTGKICVGISKILSKNNIENYILYSCRGCGYEYGIQCSNNKYIKLQALKSRILGNYGFNSEKATKKIITELSRIQPDIVHLHNIHGHDCNLEILFKYFQKNRVKIIWTFHDCWAFTGYCTYFDVVGCEKWKRFCKKCPQRKRYSWISDGSEKNFKKKREFLKNAELTIITPSQWLAENVKNSFLKNCEISIINNGINLLIFKPTESEFKKKHGMADKKVVLGVSFEWEERKGLDAFIELTRRLPENYQIVLVGTNEKTDKLLPKNIISIHRTKNQKELAEIYTAADVFINPTREENYPTVNMEAIACGTPVITFRTGGSPEIIDETCGCVVEKDDIDAMEREIIRICEEKPYSEEMCVKKAKTFDENERFKEYLKLYERIVTGRT